MCIRDRYWWRLGGQYWSWWHSYTSFFREVCDLELKGDLNKRDADYIDAESAGYWYPYPEFCIVSERHTEIYRDAQGRLHNPNGPAISWSREWHVYAIRGVRVEKDLVTDPLWLTADRIDKETNAEIRRIMLDRYGAARYLQERNARKIHEDEWGVLFRLDLPGDVEPLQVVKVVNSTPEADGSGFKDYWLRCPPSCKTAHEAVAWTFGETIKTYGPTVQT